MSWNGRSFTPQDLTTIPGLCRKHRFPRKHYIFHPYLIEGGSKSLANVTEAKFLHPLEFSRYLRQLHKHDSRSKVYVMVEPRQKITRRSSEVDVVKLL